MNNLSSFIITLVDFAKLNSKDVLDLGFYCYITEVHTEKRSINYEWLVSIRLPEGYVRAVTPVLKESCKSLMEKLEQKGYNLSLPTTSNIFSYHNQIESLILQLQQSVVDKIGYSLSISYWPDLSDDNYLWRGKISINSRWDTRFLTQIRATSLNEACIQLIEAFEHLDPL